MTRLRVPLDDTHQIDVHDGLLDNPYLPEVRRRVAKMTPALWRKFCEALAEGASPTKAAKALDVARSTDKWKDKARDRT